MHSPGAVPRAIRWAAACVCGGGCGVGAPRTRPCPFARPSFCARPDGLAVGQVLPAQAGPPEDSVARVAQHWALTALGFDSQVEC